MCRFILYLMVMMVLLTLSGTSEVLTNPEKPLDRAEREKKKIAPLTEVLRITDECGNFVFKNPRGIKVSPDGTVFVDDRNKLLQFDQKGRFLRNFLKKGEGPGEVKYFANFYVDKDAVIIGAFMPVKLIFTSFDGTFKKEFRVHKVKPFTIFMHSGNDKFLFRSNNISPGSIKTGINERIHRIIYCNNQGEVSETELSFATKDAVIKQTSNSGGVRISMDELTDFITAFDQDRFLYVAHTARYMVTQVDLKTGKIIRKFNRSFKPQKFLKKEGLEKEDARLEEIKNQKFYNDIYALRIYKGKLLVFTSFMNEKNQVLVDVFDREGRYIDNFYLKIPQVKRPDDLRRKPMCFQGGCFWTSSIDDDDNPYIIKYKFDNL